MSSGPLVQVHWASARATGELGSLLAAEDHTHLQTLRSPASRDASATSRALLRGVLRASIADAARASDASRASNASPASNASSASRASRAGDVPITRTCPDCRRPHGQPRTVGWHVSTTHTAGRVAVAVTAAGPVGLDLEEVAAVGFAGFDDVALDDRERAAVLALPVDERAAARARHWVRKEAALKAAGLGLRVDPREAQSTAAVDLELGAGYAAALCLLDGRAPQLEIIDANDLLTTWAASPRTATA